MEETNTNITMLKSKLDGKAVLICLGDTNEKFLFSITIGDNTIATSDLKGMQEILEASLAKIKYRLQPNKIPRSQNINGPFISQQPLFPEVEDKPKWQAKDVSVPKAFTEFWKTEHRDITSSEPVADYVDNLDFKKNKGGD